MIRQTPRPNNRMEPDGPVRYLKSESQIRQYLQEHSKIVSSILVDSVLTVLKNKYDFSNEKLEAFHADLKKEIDER